VEAEQQLLRWNGNEQFLSISEQEESANKLSDNA